MFSHADLGDAVALTRSNLRQLLALSQRRRDQRAEHRTARVLELRIARMVACTRTQIQLSDHETRELPIKLSDSPDTHTQLRRDLRREQGGGEVFSHASHPRSAPSRFPPRSPLSSADRNPTGKALAVEDCHGCGIAPARAAARKRVFSSVSSAFAMFVPSLSWQIDPMLM
eukprot:COSAG06_NODE_4623_length_4091_cov_16.384018_4_plen_171_part_00